MTHHTDAELLPCPFCGCKDILVKARKTTMVECKDCGSLMFDYQDGVPRSAIDAWNRRAPAAPAPKGWKLVPVTPTKEQLRAGYWSGAGEIRLHEEWARRESYERMLAAAPQTPAAAPVELPEPSAWMFGCKTVGGGVSWKLSWSKPGAGVCHRLSGEEFEQPLYTEHQVRELLAAHGIQERST